MSIQTILNTIRANSSAQYQERIPEATRNNLSEIGTALLDFAPSRNEFLDGLVNRIAFVQVSNRRFKNPLSVLKKGTKPYGLDIEDIYTNPATAQTYDGTNIADMLKITKPDTKTIFYRMNRQDKYCVSITIPQLKKAFTSEGEFKKFYNSIMTALYSGDELDEFLLMKNLVTDAIKGNKLVSMEIDYAGDEATSKEFIKLVKTVSKNFKFPSHDYNGYNKQNAEGIASKQIIPAKTWTEEANQIILIRTDVSACTSVEVLAKAFNMDQVEFKKRMIEVDNFGDTDTLAVVCDEALFQVYDDYYGMEDFKNGSNLVTNFWLHHWQTLSLSLWANAVAIKQKTA